MPITEISVFMREAFEEARRAAHNQGAGGPPPQFCPHVQTVRWSFVQMADEVDARRRRKAVDGSIMEAEVAEAMLLAAVKYLQDDHG